MLFPHGGQGRMAEMIERPEGEKEASLPNICRKTK